jgi:hypothetical protein
MLVCALATRAAQVVVVGTGADDAPPLLPSSSSSSFAAFAQALGSAALERAPSSRPQQFAQVAVSMARLVEHQQQQLAGRGDEEEAQEDETRGEAAGSAAALAATTTTAAWLGRYLAAAEAHLPNFSDRRLCQLAWASAKLWTACAKGKGRRKQEQQQRRQHHDPPGPPTPLPPLPSGECWWAALLSEAQDRLPSMRDGRDWSNLLWALARLGVAVPPGWSDDALAALTTAASSSPAAASSSSPPAAAPLAIMRPRERATVLWALARMGVAPPPRWVSHELAPALLLPPTREQRRLEAEKRRAAGRQRGREEVAGGGGGGDNEEEEPESSRDVAAMLWALARWQTLGPRPDVTVALASSSSSALATAATTTPARLADALAARAADALEREQQQQQQPSSRLSVTTTASLIISLTSLSRLASSAAAQSLGNDPAQRQRWLRLARRAMPSLSGRGLARLAAAVRQLRLRPSPEWMRALQVRALQLATRARVRAGELAAVLGLFASAGWSPGAAWWSTLLSSTGFEQVTRAAPMRELVTLLESCRAALGVGAAALARRRRRRKATTRGGGAAGEGESAGLLTTVVLGARHAPAVARWAEVLWERVRVVEVADDADDDGLVVTRRRIVEAAEALGGGRQAAAVAPLRSAAALMAA